MSEVSETLKQLLTQLANELRAKIPNATGKTAASITVDVQEKGDRGFEFTSGKITAAKHYPVLETGRRPGKMPPVESIKEWVEAKGFSFPMVTSTGKKIKNSTGLSWAIAIKISKEGSALFKAGGHSGVISDVLTDQRLDNFVEVFSSSLSRVLLSNLLTNLKIK